MTFAKVGELLCVDAGFHRVFPVWFGTGNQNGFVEVVHVRVDTLMRGCVAQQGQPPGRVSPGPQEPHTSLAGEKEGGSGGTCETLCLNHAARDPRLAWHAAGTAAGSSRQGPGRPCVSCCCSGPGPGIHVAGRPAGVGVPFPQSKRAPCSSHTCLPAGEQLSSAKEETPPTKEPSRQH